MNTKFAVRKFALAVFGLVSASLPAGAQLEGDRMAGSATHPVPAIQDTKTDARMARWRQARFGMHSRRVLRASGT